MTREQAMEYIHRMIVNNDRSSMHVGTHDKRMRKVQDTLWKHRYEQTAGGIDVEPYLLTSIGVKQKVIREETTIINACCE